MGLNHEQPSYDRINLHISIGFTLLEVLVTIVIVTLGLLGLGALHVRAMRDTTSAYLRSEATILTQDMADRIRANPFSVNAYQMTLNDFNNTYKINTAAADDCIASSCPIASLAVADLAQWSIAVANRLPGGLGSIAMENSGGINSWVISVFWDERVDPDKPEENCLDRKNYEPPLLACLRVRTQP